jgi:hypothetical protein
MLANIIRNAKKTVGGGGGGIVGGDPYFSSVSLLLHMDGTNASTSFVDSGPNALTVTSVGNAQISTAQSKYGGASGYFDGTGDYLQISNNTVFNLPGDFTVEAWFYASNLASSPCIAGKWEASKVSWALIVGTASATFAVGNNGSYVASLSFSTTLTNNTWYHIAATRSGSSIKCFINGSQIGSTQTNSSNCSSTSIFAVGFLNSSSPAYFQGYIDDLRISRFARYASNFTPPTAALPTTASSTVADPYYNYTSLLLHMDGTNASTNFVDSGPNALAVTTVGNAQVSTTQSKYGGASGYFDGTGDYLSISDATRFNFGSGDFTVEFWFYNSNSADESKCLVAINNNNPSVGYAGIRVFYWLNNTIETLISSTGSSWAVIANTAAANSVSKNAWNHYAVVRSGNTIKIFLNGTQYISDKTMTGSVYSSSSHLVGGLIVSSSVIQTFNGNIDDLRVTKYARYTSAFTPPAAALPDIYNPNTTLPVTGAALWLDASQQNTLFTDAGTTPVTTSGQSIYQWNDLSGNNRHAIQATSGNRPTWTPPASGQNGLGCSRFSSSSQWMTNTSLSLPQPFTVFARIRNNSSQAYPVVFDFSPTATGSRAILFAKRTDTTNTPSLYAGAVVGFGTVLSTGYTNCNIGGVFNGSSSIGLLNGTETSVSPGTFGGTGGYQISNMYDAATKFDGDICELIVYPFAASSIQRASILSYLNSKWGTP